jgi:amino acid adenylation domain-containing protein
MSEAVAHSADRHVKPVSQPFRRVHPTNSFVPFPLEEIHQSIPNRLEKQVAIYPDHLAVKTALRELTYRDLNYQANQIARTVLARSGPGEAPIAVVVGDDATVPAAYLGVLKAGKILVPLDPTFPPARLSYMCADSEAALIVADTEGLGLARELAAGRCPVLSCDEIDPGLPGDDLGLPISPDSLATIFYTSGSTGQPKGVALRHRHRLDSSRNAINTYHVGVGDRWTSLHARGAAVALSDTFTALLSGAALVPLNVPKLGISSVAPWLIQQEITILGCVPAVFRAFTAALTGQEVFPRLRIVSLRGEPVLRQDAELFRKYLGPTCLLANHLGSAETGILRVFFMDRETPISGTQVPVGYPVETRGVVLLDEAGGDVGFERVGEIHIRGSHVAPSYWRRPELTKAAFRPDPACEGQLLYRTGDLGLLRPDGCLELLGRNDFQVKIRGHRAETGEVEAAVLALGGIKEAAVIARTDRPGEPYLAAYLVPAAHPVPPLQAIRSRLKETLPDFMVPSAFVWLAALPVMPTGKLDREALPAPDRARPPLDGAPVPADDPSQMFIVQIWQELLNIRPIGVRDHFFELGGDSLLAVSMLAHVERQCGRIISPATFAAAPTIEALTEALVRDEADTGFRPLTVLEGHGAGTPFVFLHGDYFGGGFYCQSLARVLVDDRPFIALQPHGLGAEPIPSTIEAMAADRLEVLRAAQPRGPYLLGGYCNGALVAFEMARRLVALGEKVQFLLLIAPTTAKLAPRSPASSPDGNELTPPTGPKPISNLMSLEPAERRRTLADIYNRAVADYRPRPYIGPVTIFQPSLDPIRGNHPARGWNEVAKKVDVFLVPGGHFTAITQHAPVLGRQLRACLRAATGSPPPAAT